MHKHIYIFIIIFHLEKILDELSIWSLSFVDDVFKIIDCQFRALSDQLYRTPEHHKVVRKQVVQQVGSSNFIFTSVCIELMS